MTKEQEAAIRAFVRAFGGGYHWENSTQCYHSLPPGITPKDYDEFHETYAGLRGFEAVCLDEQERLLGVKGAQCTQ